MNKLPEGLVYSDGSVCDSLRLTGFCGPIAGGLRREYRLLNEIGICINLG